MEDSNHPAQPRGYIGAGFDRFSSWMVGYPPERCSFTTQALRIPVSDGISRIELAADLYQPLRPDGAKPLGTVLVRSPYGRGMPIALQPRAYAARGYQVLIVSCRATFGSGGELDPFRDEVQDGKAVVEWMRMQSWYTGKFATIGGSYLGYVQWALLVDPPKDMVAAVPGVSPHDFSQMIWGTGAFNLDIARWGFLVAKQEARFSILYTLGLLGKRNLDSALNGVPLTQSIQAHHGGKSPFLDTMLAKPDISDPYYAPMQLGAALERSDIPILIITGWYDLMLEQSMEQYMRLKERGCNVGLTVGPWNHLQSGSAKPMSRHGFDWIEEHLAGSSEARRSVAVQYFVTGADEWRHAASFPPQTTSSTFYLHGDGKLLEEVPSTTSTTSIFTFDPQYPTPNLGGNGLSVGSGRCNDTALAQRSDVLVFDTAPLERDLEFCGRPTVKLAHSSSSPFADVFVRVSEVDKSGQSHNLTEVFKRLDPGRDDSVDLELALYHHAHRFSKGNKIRVLVAGGNFPQYARNHGVENADNRGSDMRAVEHTVHHDAVRMSRVVFPVPSGDPA